MFRGNILFLLRIGNDCGHFRFVFSREGPLWQTAFAAPASCGSAALRGSNLALSVTACAVPPLPKGEALAKPYTLQFSRKLHRHAKGSPFGRAGALAPERARALPIRAHIPKQRYYFPFPLQKTRRAACGLPVLFLLYIGFIPVPALYQRTRCRRRRGRCGCR